VQRALSLVAFVCEVDEEPVKREADDGHERQIHPVIERWLSSTLLTHTVNVRAKARRACL